jgi:hypothetical protein
VSMPSLTMRVWIGTHVSRSNPNQVVPLNSPRVWGVQESSFLDNSLEQKYH